MWTKLVTVDATHGLFRHTACVHSLCTVATYLLYLLLSPNECGLPEEDVIAPGNFSSVLLTTATSPGQCFHACDDLVLSFHERHGLSSCRLFSSASNLGTVLGAVYAANPHSFPIAITGVASMLFHGLSPHLSTPFHTLDIAAYVAMLSYQMVRQLAPEAVGVAAFAIAFAATSLRAVLVNRLRTYVHVELFHVSVGLIALGTAGFVLKAQRGGSQRGGSHRAALRARAAVAALLLAFAALALAFHLRAGESHRLGSGPEARGEYDLFHGLWHTESFFVVLYLALSNGHAGGDEVDAAFGLKVLGAHSAFGLSAWFYDADHPASAYVALLGIGHAAIVCAALRRPGVPSGGLVVDLRTIRVEVPTSKTLDAALPLALPLAPPKAPLAARAVSWS